MRPSAHELSRRARTLGGEVRFERPVYECPACRASLAPLDRELGLEAGEQLSRGLVRKGAWCAARASFAQASADLAELLSLEVSPAELARLAHREGARVERLERSGELPLNNGAPAPPERAVIEADATCVLTRPGQDNKQIWCAVAFDLDGRGRKQEGGGRPFLAEPRYAASARDIDDFQERLRQLVAQLGLDRAGQLAFLADGAPALWRLAGEELPPGTELIQDFWHVCEHLHALAEEFWGEQAGPVFEGWKQALRQSRLERILGDLRQQAGRRRGERRERLLREIRYLESGRERMDYARFEAQGWPIGSGAVEGTCKHLVKERFGVTGARWDRERIADVLALRLAIANGQWEEAWRNPN